MIQRIIPSTNELLPSIGLGTWKVFDVPASAAHPELTNVLNQLNNAGGTLIDSSPMYGNAEEVVGNLTSKLNKHFFYATKVWIQGKEQGVNQMKQSMQKMKRTTLDLIQIHNLVDWKIHLHTLRDWKEKGLVRYIGITHYTDAMHNELENILRTETIDFVQFNYSIFARNAEKSLLPVAAEKGVATLINRPFGEGNWFNKVRNKTIPDFATELGIKSWGQYFLKFILAHSAVTCIIPATSNAQHMAENLMAASDPLPDAKTLEKMAAYLY